MKTMTHTLLALFLVSAGLAWATDSGLQESPQTHDPQTQAPQTEVLEQVESSAEITAEDLESQDEMLVSGGSCCVVECNADRIQCRQGCGLGDTACHNECVDEFSACTAGC